MKPRLWEQTGEHEMRDDGFVVPLLRPVELHGVEVAAVYDPYNLPDPIFVPSRRPEVVQYDPKAVRGLWVEKKTNCRFLVTHTVQEGYAVNGYREFREAPGVWEPWGAALQNMSGFYVRADGRVPTDTPWWPRV